MFPRPNPLKVKLDADQSIVGLYVQTASPDVVEIAAAAGYDYVILDQEHGALDFGDTLTMIRAAEASGICPIVRVPDHGATGLRRAVEIGAMGVYVPDVRTAQQARAAIDAVKFRIDGSAGTRGACPTIRATRAQGADWRRFIEWSNANVMVTILVESEEGLANLDAILAVPGIDTIVLGRFDLSHEMGLYGDRYGTTLNTIFEDFVAKAEAAGVPYVARVGSLEPEAARRERAQWEARGARIFNAGSDRELIARVFRQVRSYW